jgi:methyl-accepting chemotaxis protein
MGDHDHARLRFRLQYKLALGIGLPVAAFVVALTTAFVRRNTDVVAAGARHQAEALSTVIAEAVAPGFAFDDFTNLQNLLQTLKVLPGITYATLRKDDGTLVAGIGESIDPKIKVAPGQEAATEVSQTAVHVVRSLNRATGSGGVLRIGLSLAQAQAEAEVGMRTALWLGLLALAAAIVVGWLLGGFLARPVVALTRAAQGVTEIGDLRQTIVMHSRDEVGLLAESFMKMIGAQRGILGALQASAGELAGLATRLAGTGRRVVNGTAAIGEQMRATTTTVADMSRSLTGVERSVAILRGATQAGHHAAERAGGANERAGAAVSTMTEAVERTSTGIGEMASSVAQTAKNVEALDSALNETSGSMRSIEETVSHVQETAAQTASLSDKTSEAAQRGAVASDSTLKGIEHIRAASAATAQSIDTLALRISDVGKIVSVIDEIANQTNLLSLNAAIIAAQAGEHGKGFAVVADEIKSLSDRTRRATDEIAALIRTIQAASQGALETVARGEKSVAEGAAVGRRASEAFLAIVASAAESSAKTRVIADVTSQQRKSTAAASSAVQRIAQTVQELRKASQEQARGATEIAASAEEMRELAGRARAAGQEQTNEAKGTGEALAAIAGAADEVDNAHQLLSRESARVATAMQAIAGVSEQQTGLAGELEDVIQTLKSLVSELDSTTRRFQT